MPLLAALGLGGRTYKTVRRWLVKGKPDDYEPTVADALALYDERHEYTMMIIRDFGPALFEDLKTKIEEYRNRAESGA